jgi:RNA polymerase sigma-70 factor (ECF subfamily)
LPADDDRALATRAAAGDRQALEVLLDRHMDRVHAICSRVMRHPEDASDATQEALIAIVRGISRFDGRSEFTTWLYRVSTNSALDELRRRRRRSPAAEIANNVADTRPGVAESVTEDLHVTELLAALPNDFREAVALRDVADLDYAQIAALLDVPIGTVRSRISRGRAQLAARVGNQTDPSDRPTR